MAARSLVTSVDSGGDQEVLLDPATEAPLLPEAPGGAHSRRGVTGAGGARLGARALAAAAAVAALVACGAAWHSWRPVAGASLRHAIQASAAAPGAAPSESWGEALAQAKLQAAGAAAAAEAEPSALQPEPERALDTEVSFDCHGGRENWRKGWSIWKKRWCCTHTEGKFGCFKHLTGSCHLKGVRYSLLTGSSNQALRDRVDDAVRVALNELANTPLHGGVDGEKTVVQADLQDYADAQDNTVLHFEVGAQQDAHLHKLFTRITGERLEHVLYEGISDVEGVSDVMTESWTVTMCNVDKQAIKLPCSCKGGTPETEHCPMQGGELCASCDEGYYMEDQQCWAKECNCDAATGVGAQGAACPRDGFNFCGSCAQGFHLMRNIDTEEVLCKPNHCSCDQGTPATGKACAADQEEICASCNAGFHVNDEGVCVANECYCTHGQRLPKGDPRCKEDQTEACPDACFDFYHLDGNSGICEMNTCKCDGGTPAVGANGVGCHADRAEACVDCNGELYLRSNGKCGPKECFCENGVPEAGDACVTHKGNICHGCLFGFKLTREKQCVADADFSVDDCFCSHGKPTTKSSCRKAAAKSLSDFNSGDPVQALYGNEWHECQVKGTIVEQGLFKLDCEASEGTHSVTVEPWRLTAAVEHSCDACNTGYVLDEVTKTCKANVCTCVNGKAATGSSCMQDGLEVCSECNIGYHHEFDTDVVTQRLIVRCEPNTCYCDHGVPATATPPPHDEDNYCHTDHAQACQSCSSGYGLNHDHLCLFKRCTCDNGFEASGPRCYKNAAEDCVACKEGYSLQTTDNFMGVRHCQHGDSLVDAPFDCSLDKENSYLGWSQLKKHWCCKNENVGCLVSATQEEACTGHSLSERSCKDIGCCTFISGQCLPKDRNEEMCMKGWSLITLRSTAPNGTEDAGRRLLDTTRFPHGLCLSAVEPYRKMGRTKMEPCSIHDRKMLWSYFEESRQLKNMLGHCAVRDHETSPMEVRMMPCDHSDEGQKFEILSPGVQATAFANTYEGAQGCISAAAEDAGSKVLMGDCGIANAPVSWFTTESNMFVEHGSADSADAAAREGSGGFKAGDQVVADSTGSGDWEPGVVEAVNDDGSYRVTIGGFPYNNIPESRLSQAKGFHPGWEVQYHDESGDVLDAVVRRRDADGSYELQLTESAEIKEGVLKTQVKQVHAFSKGQAVKILIHGTWFPAKIEAQQDSGVYDVRLDADHTVEMGVKQSELSLAKGFEPGAKVWYKDPNGSGSRWDPKWTVVRKEGSGAYEISGHEGGKSVVVEDMDALSMAEGDSFAPGTEVFVKRATGQTDKATVARRYSDGSYAVLYEGHIDETNVDAERITGVDGAAPPATGGSPGAGAGTGTEPATTSTQGPAAARPWYR